MLSINGLIGETSQNVTESMRHALWMSSNGPHARSQLGTLRWHDMQCLKH